MPCRGPPPCNRKPTLTLQGMRHLNIIQGVYGYTVYFHLEVQMGSIGFASLPDKADVLSAFDILAG